MHRQDRHIDRESHDGRAFSFGGWRDRDHQPRCQWVSDFCTTDGHRTSTHAHCLRALEVGVLCSNASLGTGVEDGRHQVGDPMELALLTAAAAAGLRQDGLRRQSRSTRRGVRSAKPLMATVHQVAGQYYVAVKGAPEVRPPRMFADIVHRRRTVLSDPHREQWLQRSAALARHGFRVLAVADKTVPDASCPCTRI